MDTSLLKSEFEIKYEKRMKESVIFVTLNENIGAQQIASLFNSYGDINVRITVYNFSFRS
jgi:hypothetical protein